MWFKIKFHIWSSGYFLSNFHICEKFGKLGLVQLEMTIFRWFKFTLKRPYSIMCGKLRLAIWETSFWTFWLKFGHKGP